MILHLTNSTVSGAAAMLAEAQRASGHEALCVQLADRKPERLQFSPNAVSLDMSRTLSVDLLRELLDRARIVHVHNWLPNKIETLVLECLSASDAQLVWHAHQGQLEHPVYRADLPEGQWDKKLIVAHAFARTYDDFWAVPNCLYRPTAEPFQMAHGTAAAEHRLRVLYSPSSKTGTRWGAKRNSDFDALIEFIKRSPDISLTEAEGINPLELLVMRTRFDVTIDEVITGGFHLVSYEGLFAGTAVINNADTLSMEIFCAALGTSEPPPFLIASVPTLFDLLYELAHDADRLQRAKTQGQAYFDKYMNWQRIVKIFDDVYAA